jgi:hypothetical protein
MAAPILMRQNQIDALDQIIDAMKAGQLNPADAARGLFAPVNQHQQNNQGTITRAVQAITATQIGTITIIEMLVFAAKGPETPLPRQPKEVPREVSLEQLLEVRRRAALQP